MRFDELRQREYGRLDAGGHVYLDYTGSGLYAESQIRAHGEILRQTVLGNPHSENPTSLASTHIVEAARSDVLDFFAADPDEYEVCFTANASGALKLVGESYPFREGSRFLLTADNHNSVNGIRQFAAARGAVVEYLPLDDQLRVPEAERLLAERPAVGPSLFAFPAQSNFSGVKHPLSWIEMAREQGYDVVLDAAAFVPTNRLSLREVSPDFVSISFYKMFGYPTGVGALIGRREAMARLHRPWFAGGTVKFVSAQNGLHLLKSSAEAFEDGTLDFLSIAALAPGLSLLRDVGMDQISHHVMTLVRSVLSGMRELRHANGHPLVHIYGPEDAVDRGATVAFNVLDRDGQQVDYDVIEAEANRQRISLRGGCFCNPGAAEFAFHYSAVESYRCFSILTPEEFSLQQFSACMNGMPVGALRVSLGIASNAADVEHFLDMLGGFRDYRVPAGVERRLPEVIGG